MTAATRDRNTAIRGEPTMVKYPVAVAKIYKGTLVAIDADGYATPAANTAGLRVVGVAKDQKDNSAGSAGDLWIEVYTRAKFKFTSSSTTQAMVNSLMYVVDDQTVDDTATEGIVAGIVKEHIGTTELWLEVDANIGVAAQGFNWRFLTKTDNYTITPEDHGTIFKIATDAKVFTLPSTQAGLMYGFINTGADGAVLLSVSPAAADAIHYVTSVDDKDLLNTKSTAIEGDMAIIVGDGAEGWFVIAIKGTWAKE